jgi:hypothetical protein
MNPITNQTPSIVTHTHVSNIGMIKSRTTVNVDLNNTQRNMEKETTQDWDNQSAFMASHSLTACHST